jgi:CBS domain-containing protein
MVGEMDVEKIMTKDIISVGKNESLEHILYLMEKNDVTKVPVVEENGRLIGIITDGKIAYKLGSLRKREVSPAHLYASSVMEKNFSPISPDTPVDEIIKTVGLPGLTMLPVLKDGKLVGVVTKADLLPLVKGRIKVDRIMTRRVIYVARDDRVVHARRLLIDNDIARLPVVEDGRVEGMIAEMDIARAFAKLKKSIARKHQKHRIEELLVEDAMRSPAITTTPDTTIERAAEIMIRNNVGALPIVEEKMIGIVSRTDLIKTLR